MTAQPSTVEKYFRTPLGAIRCGFLCSEVIVATKSKKYKNGSSEIFETRGCRIEVILFKIRVPLYNGDNLTDSLGWIFRIEKVFSFDEKIEVYCLLDKKDDSISFDIATGENLDAIQADSDEWILNIGTEDGEALNLRAGMDDWFPVRLRSQVDFCKSLSEMKQNGFITTIPDLQQGEKIHIHYLAAYDRKDGQRVNTWLAVEESKRNLENWVGIW